MMDVLELYKRFTANPAITYSLDYIASMDLSKVTVNPSPNFRHRFKMKTKRLRKKLRTYPHRYYEKAYADMIAYTMHDFKMQIKFAKALHKLDMYGNAEMEQE